MTLFNVLLLALILSLDAFSIGISISSISNYNLKTFALFNGIFHFIFPMLGYYLGQIISLTFDFNYTNLVTMVYILIIVEIIIDFFKNDIIKINSYFNILLLSISVSLDSFSIGLTLTGSFIKVLISCMIFSLFAYSISLLGMTFGNTLKNKIGYKAKLISLILMIFVLTRHLLVQ